MFRASIRCVLKPPTYTVQELEQTARQFLAARFGQDVPIPVDVGLLIEHEAGVDLDYWPGLRDNHGLDGMLCRDVETGELLVYIDEWLADNRPTRYRMTVAEELGHLVLHRAIIDQTKSPVDADSAHRVADARVQSRRRSDAGSARCLGVIAGIPAPGLNGVSLPRLTDPGAPALASFDQFRRLADRDGLFISGALSAIRHKGLVLHHGRK